MLFASSFMQERGKETVEMKAVEEQRRVRNQPTRDVCFHGSNKYTNGSHGKFCVSLFCVLLAAKM
jgi:hypothetical protein